MPPLHCMVISGPSQCPHVTPNEHPVQPIIPSKGNSSRLFHIAHHQSRPRILNTEEDENSGISPEGTPLLLNAGQVESAPFMSPIGLIKI